MRSFRHFAPFFALLTRVQENLIPKLTPAPRLFGTCSLFWGLTCGLLQQKTFGRYDGLDGRTT